MTLIYLMKYFYGTPCYNCDFLIREYGIFGTSCHCNQNEDWYEIYDHDHEQQGDNIKEHCQNICKDYIKDKYDK